MLESPRAHFSGIAPETAPETAGAERGAPANLPAEPGAERAIDPCALFGGALRAEARAAFRCVQGGPDCALDHALQVMEAEIARLQSAILSYGEALKRIEVYATDSDARATARRALRATPQRLRRSAPAPRHDAERLAPRLA
jgi:hypothetical protein